MKMPELSEAQLYDLGNRWYADRQRIVELEQTVEELVKTIKQLKRQLSKRNATVRQHGRKI
jgi:uncharacterized protein YukE